MLASDGSLQSRLYDGVALSNARAILSDLRVRDQCLPVDIVGDYRWRTLLVLYIAAAEQRDLRFVDLFDEIRAPNTTARRIVVELERLGFVAVRLGNRAMSQKKLVSLTAIGLAHMTNYFDCRCRVLEAARARRNEGATVRAR